MEYRSLGRTGVKVSALCLGCMNFGGRTNDWEAGKIIEYALENGVNFIDTADVYGHDPDDFETGRGRSEEIVGRALEGKRDQVILATKAHFPMGSGINNRGSSRYHVIEACEASLRRLNTDYIDLYQMHHPPNEIPIDETLRALDDLIRAGKVRYIGSSSFGAWQIVESLWVAKELGLNRFISEQPAYNLLDRRIERELIPMAQTYGIAVLPWSPTAGGFLSGKYRREEAMPENSRFEVFWSGSEVTHFTDVAFEVLKVVTELAESKGCTLYQVALAWCVGQLGITSVIMGPRTYEQLQDSLVALEVSITEEDRALLDRVAPPGRVIVPYYGYDGMTWVPWGPHQQRW